MSSGPILITGGTGFVGRSVVKALRSTVPLRLRLLVHQTSPADLDGSIEMVRADLADPGSLGRACHGVDSVIHLASEISDDERRCMLVNGRGTEALVAEAQRAGVRCFLYLGNTAVYGYAVHRGVREAETTVAPATPVSRSRA
ncbi:MAG TPA: NAD-dependent epimerase/dehydratase family protein, partial [Terriglobales bacterium]|nr:NAD-dependent epimerase/dehydratase family protein [Terriglobales bacterium]